MKFLGKLVGWSRSKFGGIFLVRLPWEVSYFKLPVFKELTYHKNNRHTFHKSIYNLYDDSEKL